VNILCDCHANRVSNPKSRISEWGRHGVGGVVMAVLLLRGLLWTEPSASWNSMSVCTAALSPRWSVNYFLA